MQYLRLKQHGIDMFFVHTNLERDLLINDGIEERKIHKVTYPCIASKFLERLSFKREHASSFTILYIGRIAYRKGIHILLEALPNIIEYSGDVVALIAGPKEEEYYKKLLQLVDVLNLRKYVILKQALSEQEKYEYMRSCQVFVSPSIRDYTPVTLIEAQAFGKPVVSTRVGAIPEIVNKGHTGLLVAPKNAKELAEAIKWLILNENERRSMGLNARRWVKDNFLLENTINQIERLYINCLNQ
jgi:glycosyltransferase involved in cell wall biosynthesis